MAGVVGVDGVVGGGVGVVVLEEGAVVFVVIVVFVAIGVVAGCVLAIRGKAA